MKSAVNRRSNYAVPKYSLLLEQQHSESGNGIFPEERANRFSCFLFICEKLAEFSASPKIPLQKQISEVRACNFAKRNTFNSPFTRINKKQVERRVKSAVNGISNYAVPKYSLLLEQQHSEIGNGIFPEECAKRFSCFLFIYEKLAEFSASPKIPPQKQISEVRACNFAKRNTFNSPFTRINKRQLKLPAFVWYR